MNPEGAKRAGKVNLAAAADPNVREAQDRLQRRLGLRVRIEDRKGKGRVIIEYSGVEDFDAILSALGKDA
jgi:ParB family chromosome partitioning protein